MTQQLPYHSYMTYHPILYIALANFLKMEGTRCYFVDIFCMWMFLYESHDEDGSCGLLKECAQTESWTCFVTLKESNRKKSLYADCRVLQRKNWTTEEAKSTGPLFVKGLLHWISPRGHQAPPSGQIHPPSWHVPLLQEGGCLKWGITDSSPSFLHTLYLGLILFFMIIWIELYFTGRVDSTIFRIEATAPFFSVTLSRHVPPFCCCRVSAVKWT